MSEQQRWQKAFGLIFFILGTQIAIQIIARLVGCLSE